jgi:hypothetical protein
MAGCAFGYFDAFGTADYKARLHLKSCLQEFSQQKNDAAFF